MRIKMEMPLVMAFLVFTLAGCGTVIDLSKIQTSSQPLLAPTLVSAAYETDFLRIDLIRQQEDSQLDDSTTTTSDVPYHPLGFDLGNGLFYDLNGNLGLNVKSLWSIRETEAYEIQKTVERGKGKGRTIFRRSETELCSYWKGLLRKEKSACREFQRVENTLQVNNKGKFAYKLVKTEGELRYTTSKRERRWTTIKKEGENEYAVGEGRRRKEYKKVGDELILGRGIMLRLEEDENRIGIYSMRKRGNRFRYYLQKTPGAWYLYDKQYRGYKIEIADDQLTVHRNKRKLYELKRVE